MGDQAKDFLIDCYLETIEQVGPAAFDAAFKHVFKVSKFRPDIAEIRDVLGLNRDQVEDEAKAELNRVLAAMRTPHGPRLKQVLGEVLSKRSPDGRGLPECDWLRAEPTPGPVFTERTERALRELGCGMRELGLQVIAEHPGSGPVGDPGRHGMVFRTMQRIEQAFVAAYRKVGA